jgi:hypothetical protein
MWNPMHVQLACTKAVRTGPTIAQIEHTCEVENAEHAGSATGGFPNEESHL